MALIGYSLTAAEERARQRVVLALDFPTIEQAIHTAEDLCQLRIVQFDTLLVTRGVRELKRTCLQPLVPNAEAVLIPKQDLDPIPITVEEQE